MNEQLKRPVLYFLPFLVIYVLLILFMDRNPLLGDGKRYLMFAENLCQGFYSPPERLNLWNGPGYPIFLMPFVALGLPLKSMVIANAFLLYGSAVYFFKACQFILPPRKAILAGVGLSFYLLIAFREMSIIAYEALSLFLICAFLYYLIRAYRTLKSRDLWIAGFLIGYLVLTRVIFGYVLVVSLLVMGVALIISKEKKFIIKSISILAIGLLTTLPYLFYTFHLTGNIFYLGNSGGRQLYWMATPFPAEYGEFNRVVPSSKNQGNQSEFPEINQLRLQYLRQNHQAFFEEVGSLNELEKDAAFRNKALDYIKANPGKYLKNIVANFGRLFFGIPQSYSTQRVNVLFRIGLHSFLLVFMSICGVLSIFQWKLLSFPVRFVLTMAVIYLGGSLLVSATPRFFYIVVPLFAFWIIYVLEHLLVIKLKSYKND